MKPSDTPQQIADEMNRIMDDTTPLLTLREQAIRKLQGDETMKDGICTNCGYWSGLHHWKTHQCPVNENETGDFADTVYSTDESPIAAKLATAEKRVAELEKGIKRIADMGEAGSTSYTLAEIARRLLGQTGDNDPAESG